MSTLVASSEGQFIKALPAFSGERIYGWHKAFGLISQDEMERREIAAKRKGQLIQTSGWLCRFKVAWNGSQPTLSPVEGCQVKSQLGGWAIEAGKRSWSLSTQATNLNMGVTEFDHSEDSHERKIALLALLFFLLVAPALIFWNQSKVEKVEEVLPEPITVVVQQHKTVTVAATVVDRVVKEMPKEQKRAVMQNLGFLGLVGRKDLKKAVGGAQLKLNASPGAGAGGNEGSGGEVLAGLGKGVRATTVGNTGVQGLGGVGTKGKGGGGGGYGDVDIASGEGRGISSIAVSQAVGVDGGLDRHVIQATIAKYLSQVRACYEDRLRVNPGLEGTLTMDFEIGGTGRLNFSKVKSSSVGDAQVGSCVANRMMGWEFPKPRGGVNVKVTYPFNLRPVSR